MARVELNEEILDNIVGGAYTYVPNEDPQYPILLTITNKEGTVLASYKGNKYMEADVEELRMKNPTMKVGDVVAYIAAHPADFPNMILM